ncbi:MAG TPA: SulP family inorganic anion transporter [Aggregatilineaceae bacterium]|nr:SulP family inorganic anion transporter [Aggregatilineaceae bacterium]
MRRDLLSDLSAGITGATAGAPQAMAFAIVAGISPVYGLYTAIISTIVASLIGSSTYMTTGPTNALAVVVASTLAPFAGQDDLLARLITLTFLVGVIQLLMGVFRLGGLTRFVSAAVMTGFVTGAALLVLLGQLNHLTGIHTQEYAILLQETGELLLHLPRLNVPTFLTGTAAMLLIVALHQSRLSNFATLIAIIITSLGVALLNWDEHGVLLVSDLSHVPRQLPDIRLPDAHLIPELAAAALAIAVLGLVQTAALSQTLREPNNQLPNASREFLGQGAANLLGSLFQTMPAGGSLSRTAVNLKAGAHTRWANVWSGLFVALLMILGAPLVERITLAALAGHLIVAAISLISPARIRFIWHASWRGRWAMLATLLATLILPLQYAVYVGVLLSLTLHLQQSSHLRITQLIPVGDHLFREVKTVPHLLPSAEPIILSIQGSLFFAAMREVEARLPRPTGSRYPVVILRLRGDVGLAGTGISTLVNYAERLREHQGKLILCGVDDQVLQTLTRTGAINRLGRENIFPATDVLLLSTSDALHYARTWLDELPETHKNVINLD